MNGAEEKARKLRGKFNFPADFADFINSIPVSYTHLTGTGNVERISMMFDKIPAKFPEINFGAHFHNRYEDSYIKLKAAYENGCLLYTSRCV